LSQGASSTVSGHRRGRLSGCARNADNRALPEDLKEELVWPHEWTSPAVFFQALDRWLADCNATYLHSALGYRAPNVVEAEHLGHVTPLAAAC
jgi:putative transposase